MRKNVRIIPRLDIKGPNLVKGIHLEGLRVMGKPERFAKYYYENGADELLYMDVVASLYGRNNLLEIVEKTSKEIFIPLTVGGGLRSIEDIKAVLRAGADKVSLNTAAIENPDLIRDASRRFGASTIVVSIEAIKRPDGTYEAYTNNGREYTGVEVTGWAVRAAELGAGELIITSIDREGTGEGFDTELIRKISLSVPIPVIACGGAGTKEHVREAIVDGAADAVSIASVLHYNCIRHVKMYDDFSKEGNIEFLTNKKVSTMVKDVSIGEIKSYLGRSGIDCRYTDEGLHNVRK